MRIIKFNARGSLHKLEAELDRIADKHDIEPRLRTMSPVDIFNEEIGFDYGEEDEYER